MGAYKSIPIAVLKHKTGFPLIQIHLEKLTVIYTKRTQERPARKHIKKECNTIWAIIAHQFWPRMKPLMQPTRQDKLKKMVAAITGTSSWPADLSEAQYRKSRRAKI